MKSISLYVNNGSWLTKVHPFTKLAYILAAIAIPLIGERLWLYAVLIAVSLALLGSGGVVRKSLPLISFSFTLIVVIFLIQGLFNANNRHLLFSLGPLHFYREGVLYALRIGLNILNMLLSFAVLCLTTVPAQLSQELERIGFPASFGYILSSVFQIIPQMSGTMNTITDAQRSRGMETEGNLLTRAKAFLPLISPVVTSSLINTRERAIALEVRGFASKKKKTFLVERKKHRGDTLLTLIALGSIVLVVVLRVMGILG